GEACGEGGSAVTGVVGEPVHVRRSTGPRWRQVAYTFVGRDVKVFPFPEDIRIGVRAVVELGSGVDPALRPRCEAENVERAAAAAPHVRPPGTVVPPDGALRALRSGGDARAREGWPCHSECRRP